jgi:hypothetical protein
MSGECSTRRRDAYKILVGISKAIRLHRRPRRRWEILLKCKRNLWHPVNMKMDLGIL